LVAFTVEVDNELAKKMAQAGYAASGLSLVVWLNLIRFFAGGGRTVKELARLSLSPKEGLGPELGCLERWGYIVLEPSANEGTTTPKSATIQTPGQRRAGWGSGRGIRAEWFVDLTAKGRHAAASWPPLVAEVERRWSARFGRETVRKLRELLPVLINRVPFDLPQGLPFDLQIPRRVTLPPKSEATPATLPLAALLSQALYAFKLEFEARSQTSLALSANTLRVLGVLPIPVGEITRLTGASPETSGVGWQLKPYVLIEPDPARRVGKVIRLNERGRKAQAEYYRLMEQLEKAWEERLGRETVAALRGALESLFNQVEDGQPLLSAGLVPLPGVPRAGGEIPALGRKTIGPAARRRIRDLVAQTKAFVIDPANALPHYPLWDMNRGFGP
jgi:DNA-binding MarR family transcriptional regulator